jgi:hypothetical protein
MVKSILSPQKTAARFKKLKKKLVSDGKLVDYMEQQQDPVTGQFINKFVGKTVPNKASLTKSLVQFVNENPAQLPQVVKAVFRQAKLGNMVAVQFIADRLDGKVAEVHRIDMEKQVTLNFIKAEQQQLAAPRVINVIEGEVVKQEIATEVVEDAKE